MSAARQIILNTSIVNKLQNMQFSSFPFFFLNPENAQYEKWGEGEFFFLLSCVDKWVFLRAYSFLFALVNVDFQVLSLWSFYWAYWFNKERKKKAALIFRNFFRNSAQLSSFPRLIPYVLFEVNVPNLNRQKSKSHISADFSLRKTCFKVSFPTGYVIFWEW